ncbi:MAG: hypothetical protein M1491_03120 [Deltaproteobacteria bacterium]|nr:hypothetical protein [Deltaproteobacteria bacterium]
MDEKDIKIDRGQERGIGKAISLGERIKTIRGSCSMTTKKIKIFVPF